MCNSMFAGQMDFKGTLLFTAVGADGASEGGVFATFILAVLVPAALVLVAASAESALEPT